MRDEFEDFKDNLDTMDREVELLLEDIKMTERQLAAERRANDVAFVVLLLGLLVLLMLTAGGLL